MYSCIYLKVIFFNLGKNVITDQGEEYKCRYVYNLEY